MNNINEIFKLKKERIKKYLKIGKVIVIETDKAKYAYKEKEIDREIINYLNTRNFNYYPKIIKNEKYLLTNYIEEVQIPKEQKMNDLIKLVALMHSKTTFYKEINLDYYNSIYDNINNNLEYLYSYYTDKIALCESKVFMSPSEYLLARNISKIYESLDKNRERLEKWHRIVKNKNKERNTVIHNDLKLEHFIRNENSYLISWDKAKINSPVFDLQKLYNNHFFDFDFSNIFKTYEKTYPLLDEEKILLKILISIPGKPENKQTEYDKTKEINNIIIKINKAEKIILPEASKSWKHK